jgi:hypothetical protein
MTRHRRSLSRPRPAILAAFVLPVVLVAAACNNEPAAPELTDPTAILQAAATQTASATAFHLDLAADGEFSLDLTGTGVGAPLSLADTTATADVDIAGGDARVTFALPGILGLRGELIAVDGTAWVKTTMTGPLYREVPMGDALPTDPGASPDTGSMLDALGDFLEQPGLDPVRGEDVECGSATCYTVQIDLTAAELAALGGDGAELPIPSGLPIPLPDLGDFGLALTIRVEKATTNLAGLTAVASAGELGDVTAELTFSKWNEAVTITPPPADQIDSNGLLP